MMDSDKAKEKYKALEENELAMELLLDFLTECAPDENVKNNVQVLRLYQLIRHELERLVEGYNPAADVTNEDRLKAIDFLESILAALKNFPR